MITISTTTKDEARAMHAVMIFAPAGLDYGIYLLGREVTAEEASTV